MDESHPGAWSDPGVDLAGARGRGRPRSERAESAILASALELLAEDGFGKITMESIAARAGVGKATIYRRWKKKNDLMVDAVTRMTEPVRPVRTDDLRADLIAMVDESRRKMSESTAGKIMPRLMSAAIDDPELMRVYWERSVRPRRELLEHRFQAAIADGELRADVDVDLLCDMLVSPVVYRKLFREVRALPDRALVEKLVDHLLSGACPRP